MTPESMNLVKIQNVADFRRLIVIGQTTESITLDFKKDLDGHRVRGSHMLAAQKEVCKDISQFTNTYGGSLILGIEEGRNGPLKVAQNVHALDDFDSRREWIEQAIQNFLVPSTFPIEILPIQLPEGLVIVVNVPAYQHLVSIWDRDTKTVQCVRRTNHGKEYLNPDQIEAHLMDTSRACKLNFLRVAGGAQRKTVQLVSGVWSVSNGGPVGSGYLLKTPADIELERTYDYEFRLIIKNQFLKGLVPINVPYGLINESWITSENQIGLMLKVRLITNQDRNSLTMEPL